MDTASRGGQDVRITRRYGEPWPVIADGRPAHP